MFRLFFTIACILSLASVVICGCANSLISDLSFTPVGRKLVWPDPNVMELYSLDGRYIPKNIIVTRMQINKGGAIIAMPRLKPGVPFTLGIMALNKKASEVITPFPCLPIQEEGNCQALQNAVDIYLDIQDILWVLDSGIVNILTQPVRRCMPKVVGIDTKTGKSVQVIDLEDYTIRISNLQYIVVEYSENGEVFLYITDAPTRSIIVYDVIDGRGHRVQLPREVCLTGSLYDELYIVLIRKNDDTSVLYFTYHNSSRLFSIETSYLKYGSVYGAIKVEGPKKNKIVLLGTDGSSSIFFRNAGHSDVYKWNVNTPFSIENYLLIQKGNECRLPTHIVSGMRNTMWTLESNFLDYVSNTVPRSGPSMSIHPIISKIR